MATIPSSGSTEVQYPLVTKKEFMDKVYGKLNDKNVKQILNEARSVLGFTKTATLDHIASELFNDVKVRNPQINPEKWTKLYSIYQNLDKKLSEKTTTVAAAAGIGGKTRLQYVKEKALKFCDLLMFLPNKALHAIGKTYRTLFEKSYSEKEVQKNVTNLQTDINKIDPSFAAKNEEILLNLSLDTNKPSSAPLLKPDKEKEKPGLREDFKGWEELSDKSNYLSQPESYGETPFSIKPPPQKTPPPQKHQK
jgi:hypothetical protein